MPRKKLATTRSASIEIMVTPDDKAAFERWCEASSTTMSEVTRQAIAPYVKRGRVLLEIGQNI
jgi:hypothetical protein